MVKMISDKHLEHAKELPPITKGLILSSIDFYIDFFEEYLKTGHTDNLENKSLSDVTCQVNHKILEEFERTVMNFHPQMVRDDREPFDPNLLPTREDTLNILEDLRRIREELLKTMPMEKEETE